jgi:hypothetical protein
MCCQILEYGINQYYKIFISYLIRKVVFHDEKGIFHIKKKGDLRLYCEDKHNRDQFN